MNKIYLSFILILIIFSIGCIDSESDSSNNKDSNIKEDLAQVSEAPIAIVISEGAYDFNNDNSFEVGERYLIYCSFIYNEGSIKQFISEEEYAESFCGDYCYPSSGGMNCNFEQEEVYFIEHAEGEIDFDRSDDSFVNCIMKVNGQLHDENAFITSSVKTNGKYIFLIYNTVYVENSPIICRGEQHCLHYLYLRSYDESCSLLEEVLLDKAPTSPDNGVIYKKTY